MEKAELPAQTLIPVRPILIVGASVDGKPNFMEVGGGGSVSTEPPMIALPIRHQRHTLKGIMAHMTLSVNVPSVDLAREADYCGIISGANRDKVEDCQFSIFYGKLATAPMIEQCPVNMECSVVHILGSKSHAIIIVRVDATYISEEYLKDGSPNYADLEPLLWFGGRKDYVGVGGVVGKSGLIGKELKAWQSTGKTPL